MNGPICRCADGGRGDSNAYAGPISVHFDVVCEKCSSRRPMSKMQEFADLCDALIHAASTVLCEKADDEARRDWYDAGMICSLIEAARRGELEIAGASRGPHVLAGQSPTARRDPWDGQPCEHCVAP